MERLAGGVDDTEGHLILRVDVEAVLHTETHVVVFHLQDALEERGGRGAVYVGVVEQCAEQVAEVETDGESLEGTCGQTDEKLVESPGALVLVGAVGNLAAEFVTDLGVWHHTDGHAAVAGHRELEGHIVKAAGEVLAGFLDPVAGLGGR